jgi:uncharacterized protein (TIGR00725 family)
LKDTVFIQEIPSIWKSDVQVYAGAVGDSVQTVAVIGAGAASARLITHAEEVGRALAGAGYRIVCGGLGGVMEAACRGAARAGGCAIGILPGLDASAANPHVDIVIPTGMGLARNLIVVATADAVIAIGGGSGTLSEIALAWQLGKPIVALEVGEGWSSQLAGQALDGRRTDRIVPAADARDAVRKVQALLASGAVAPRC